MLCFTEIHKDYLFDFVWAIVFWDERDPGPDARDQATIEAASSTPTESTSTPENGLDFY